MLVLFLYSKTSIQNSFAQRTSCGVNHQDRFFRGLSIPQLFRCAAYNILSHNLVNTVFFLCTQKTTEEQRNCETKDLVLTSYTILSYTILLSQSCVDLARARYCIPTGSEISRFNNVPYTTG